jgi:predicted Zn finger-like uncharacterized protein
MNNRVHLGDTMQTTCPHCASVFRVNTTLLEMGHGRVRCGICQQNFNALLTLENYHGEAFELLPEATHPISAADDEAQAPGAPDDSPQPDKLNDADAQADEAEKSVSLHEAMYGDGARSRANLKPLLWFIGILMLLIIAIVQVIYYQRYQLISSLHYQSQILNLCQILPCDEDKFVNTSQISLLERNIFTHPTRDKALMVTGSFVNKAPFSQPPPKLLISLSDQQGNFIASRRFEPQQYLADKSITRLPPGKPVQFRLEIEDPGNAALAYEFEFFP